MQRPHLKLTPALVPGPLWGRSVYRRLPRKQWKALRGSVLETAANTCAHCAATYYKNMVCHEVWASLVSASDDALADRGDHLIAQLMKVNGISERGAHKLLDDAFGKWMDRSKHKTWAIKIAPELIEKYPALAGVKL